MERKMVGEHVKEMVLDMFRFIFFEPVEKPVWIRVEKLQGMLLDSLRSLEEYF